MALPLALLVLCQLVLVGGPGSPIFGELSDPDGYMRLVRVQELDRQGGWFDPRIERIMPPEGHVQHWTRPLDGLLWLGGKALQPALGFERGLLVAGTLFSPLCLALAILAMSWASAPLLGREGRFVACLLLPLQPWVLSYAGLGRPDHHSLLLLLVVLLLGLTIRASSSGSGRRWAWGGGIAAGAALWVSTEALVVVAAMVIAVGLPWLRGDGRAARNGQAFAISGTMALLAAMLIERGGHDPLQPDNDRLSIVHVTLLASMALFWTVVRRWPGDRMASALLGRATVAGAGATAAAILMVALFPDLRNGILGEVDPVYRELRLQRIVEIQPLLELDRLARGQAGAVAARAILAFGLALIALPVLARHLWTGPGDERRRWLPVVVALSVFLPLTFYQIRWGMYAQALLVLPYALAIVRFAHAMDSVRAPLRVVVRPVVIAVSLVWPHAAAQAFPAVEAKVSADKSCPMRRLAPMLVRMTDRPMTIMAIADLGPEILYRTHHAVLSIPNHRPQPGFVLTARVLGSDEPEVAERRMRRAGVDWILICGAGQASLFGAAAGGEATLYHSLVAGMPPDWLRVMPLSDLPQVRLFALRDADGTE